MKNLNDDQKQELWEEILESRDLVVGDTAWHRLMVKKNMCLEDVFSFMMQDRKITGRKKEGTTFPAPMLIPSQPATADASSFSDELEVQQELLVAESATSPASAQFVPQKSIEASVEEISTLQGHGASKILEPSTHPSPSNPSGREKRRLSTPSNTQDPPPAGTPSNNQKYLRHAIFTPQIELDRAEDDILRKRGVPRVYIDPYGSEYARPNKQGRRPNRMVAVFKSAKLKSSAWLEVRAGTWKEASKTKTKRDADKLPSEEPPTKKQRATRQKTRTTDADFQQPENPSISVVPDTSNPPPVSLNIDPQLESYPPQLHIVQEGEKSVNSSLKIHQKSTIVQEQSQVFPEQLPSIPTLPTAPYAAGKVQMSQAWQYTQSLVPGSPVPDPIQPLLISTTSPNTAQSILITSPQPTASSLGTTQDVPRKQPQILPHSTDDTEHHPSIDESQTGMTTISALQPQTQQASQKVGSTFQVYLSYPYAHESSPDEPLSDEPLLTTSYQPRYGANSSSSLYLGSNGPSTDVGRGPLYPSSDLPQNYRENPTIMANYSNHHALSTAPTNKIIFTKYTSPYAEAGRASNMTPASINPTPLPTHSGSSAQYVQDHSSSYQADGRTAYPPNASASSPAMNGYPDNGMKMYYSSPYGSSDALVPTTYPPSQILPNSSPPAWYSSRNPSTTQSATHTASLGTYSSPYSTSGVQVGSTIGIHDKQVFLT